MADMESILHADGTAVPVRTKAWLTTVAERGYQAVIFDCDGTLIHSADAHFCAFEAALEMQGHGILRSWYDARAGLDRRSLLNAINSALAQPLDIEMAIAESKRAFHRNTGRITTHSNVARFAQQLHCRMPLAVGTNAEGDIADAALRAVGLRSLFRFIVSVSNALPPKPSPDIFAVAGQRLKTSPNATLVVEDSREGVAAALAAGMDVLQVMSTTSRDHHSDRNSGSGDWGD